MKNVLFVDCCIRREASNTKKLAEAFLSALPSDCAVTRLDLMAEDLSYFKDSYFDQREALLAENRRDHPRFRYAHQFAQADRIVIAAPFWDLSFPALLKVYIEQVSVDGITFGSTEDGLKGLCRASHLVFLTTRGGFYTGDAMEMGSRYLEALHTFFGIGEYTCIAADGMNVAGFDAEASLRPRHAGGRAAGRVAIISVANCDAVGYNTTIKYTQEVIFMAAKIEKTTIIGDVLDIAPETAPLFMAIGMHCLGCPSSRGETVEEACMVHGVDADAFLAQVNRFIEASEEAEKAK